MYEICEICKKFAVLQPQIHIWSGRKKLCPEDIRADKLPPPKLASLGSKKIVDPEKLKVFHRLKKKVERRCLEIGTRFLGGFAVPDEYLKEVIEHMEVIKMEFYERKRNFIQEYTMEVEKWAAQFPEFEYIIRTSVEEPEKVERAFSFEYTVFRILPHRDSPTLGEKVSRIGDYVLKEVEQEAKEWLEQSLLGKTEVTRRALRPLIKIEKKLRALSFTDGAIAAIVKSIAAVIKTISGKVIRGESLERLLGIAQLLSDRDRMRKHGSGILTSMEWMLEPELQIELELEEGEEGEEGEVSPSEEGQVYPSPAFWF